MTTFFHATEINADNIALAKDGGIVACDQARELEIGCVTWAVLYGSQRGQMTVWPNGRGAVCWGSDSVWGDWDAERKILACDERNEDGEPMMVGEDGVALATTAID